MRSYPRPEQRYLSVERVPVNGEVCEECGSSDIRAYPVLSEGGWWNVQKCQRCLASIRRERGDFFGGLELEVGKIPGMRADEVFGRTA